MASRSVNVDIGRVSAGWTALDISLTAESGDGSVCFATMDCGDGRKAIHCLIMDTAKYAELKRMIAETDAAIEQLRAEGHLKPDQLR